jgi:hypothetical protein
MGLPTPPRATSQSPGVDPLDFPAEPASNSGVMKGLCVVGAGLAICGIGLIFKALSPSTPEPAKAAVSSPMVNAMSKQAAVTREAMNMAKQAQLGQRERLDVLRQEMELGERAPEGILPAGMGGE